jgi:acylphosphatase
VTEVRRLIVTGVVQGVGYRYGMAMAARRHDVTGWVRNRCNGSVEAMIEGDAEAVAAMIAWARHGPSGAAVEHVAVELGSGDFTDFRQLPTE